jgi:hypothetical protein
MIEIEQLHIDRIVIHRVHKKSDTDSYGYVEYSENLFSFGVLELSSLRSRIGNAFSKAKRFFKLEIEKNDENSFYGYSKQLRGASEKGFLETSKSIADLLAISHNTRTIPAGLLLVMDGFFARKHFVLVIKAEIQEAFIIKEMDNKKLVELVNDLFLSPAKDFYKIGFMVEEKSESNKPNEFYSCYMYDDNFSSGKRDLAEYFYKDFMGLSTSKNDALLTKNFRNDIFEFIENHVDGFDNTKGLKSALNSLYRENTTGIINPQEFAETHFSEDLLRLFGSEIASKYPSSFTKDLILVDKSLHRGHVKLVDDLKLEGPIDSIGNVSVSSGKNFDFETFKLQVEKGEIKQVVVIKTD